MEQALTLDAKNGNTLWAGAISKELENVKVAFKILPYQTNAPTGHYFVPCHFVFDIKMEFFRNKTRLVIGGHMTKAPATVTYASVVSRETVRIDLMIATLNDLEDKLNDILNVYVQIPVTKKVWTTFDPEFSKDAVK